MKVNQVIKITLSLADLKWCQTHAEESVDQFGGERSMGSGTYRHNKISGNLVGVKGEVALANWLDAQKLNTPVMRNFAAQAGGCDIFIGERHVEVKGLRPNQWRQYKRMIPPRQLEAYVREKAIVVWTTATGDSTNGLVQLQGWNLATEVKEHGTRVKTICDNVWLKDDKLMHPLLDLPALLKRDAA